jgi:SAM-dependent methyltransferase
MDSKERFSDRVDDYVRYRPGYPAALRDLLAHLGLLASGRVVADVGSGTGIFARLLLQTGARVIGIEPNAPMRAAAEAALGSDPAFDSKEASAEATGLPEVSVDLVTAAQSFHWFEPVRTRIEFARILKPGGHVALVWNERIDTPFNRDYEAMLKSFALDYGGARERDRAAEPAMRAFFAPSPVHRATFPNEQRLDEAGLRGRLMSSSYAPQPGHPLHDPMMAELASIFRAHATRGSADALSTHEIAVTYETVVWYGQLS